MIAAGVAYLITSVASEFFIRDDIESWLDEGRYGKNPKGWTIIEEFERLQLLLNKPSVFAQSTSFYKKSTKKRSRVKGHYNQIGYYVLIALPENYCDIEVVQLKYFGLEAQQENQQLELSKLAWLSSDGYQQLINEGLPTIMEDDFLEDHKIQLKEQIVSKYCLLSLPFADDDYHPYREFIIKIFRPNRKLCWEYVIDMFTRSSGQTIEPKFSDDSTKWGASFEPVIFSQKKVTLNPIQQLSITLAKE